MDRIQFAAVAAAVLLGSGLSTAAAQQTTTSPSDAGSQPGAATQASPAGETSGTARVGDPTKDPAKVATYIQMRKYLQSQVFSVTGSDLSKDRATIDKLLKSANRQWMTTDEFIEFHKRVQTDPALKTMVEAEMGKESGVASGAPATTGTSTSGAGAPSQSPSGSSSSSGPATPSSGGAASSSGGAQPGASPK